MFAAPPGGGWFGLPFGFAFCWLAAMSLSCLLKLFIRAFTSSTESCSDCTWLETWSSRPAASAFCCCKLLFSVSTLTDILLTLSVVCSTRFFITPMRSSNDCCIRAICSCSACTCVCSWIMSLLAAKPGRAEQHMANARNTNRNDFFISFPLDAELLLGVEIGSPGLREKLFAEKKQS